MQQSVKVLSNCDMCDQDNQGIGLCRHRVPLAGQIIPHVIDTTLGANLIQVLNAVVTCTAVAEQCCCWLNPTN